VARKKEEKNGPRRRRSGAGEQRPGFVVPSLERQNKLRRKEKRADTGGTTPVGGANAKKRAFGAERANPRSLAHRVVQAKGRVHRSRDTSQTSYHGKKPLLAARPGRCTDDLEEKRKGNRLIRHPPPLSDSVRKKGELNG